MFSKLKEPEDKGSSNKSHLASLRTDVLEELEKTFVSKRLECVTPQGFLSTPLHIVKTMAESHSTRLHSEVYIIHHGGEIHGDRIYRVEILCGRARGIGQAPVRGLAFQLAAIDMLEKIKQYNKDQLPMYGLPPGCRVHPHVLKDLFEMCRRNEIPLPRVEFQNSQEPFEARELYDCTVTVGQLQICVKSDSRHMARRLAAKEMYNAMSTLPYPEMLLAYGSDCVGLKRLRELGIHPLISNTKKEWLEKYRMTDDGKFVQFPDEEPDDSDLVDPEDLVNYSTKTDMKEETGAKEQEEPMSA